MGQKVTISVPVNELQRLTLIINYKKSDVSTMFKKADKIDYTVSDEDIIAEIMSGNVNAYEIIMRRYNQRLFRIGHSYLRDDKEIEDAIQNAYIKAYEQLDRFEKKSRFSTWLIRIFINEALLRIRLKNRFCSYSEEICDTKTIDSDYSRNREITNPYYITVNNELKDILEKAVNELPLKYREVFIMREIEDMNISETSKCLKISESNVKIRLMRAKEMLRENLSTYYHYKDVYNFNLIICSRIVDKVLFTIFEHQINKEKQYDK